MTNLGHPSDSAALYNLKEQVQRHSGGSTILERKMPDDLQCTYHKRCGCQGFSVSRTCYIGTYLCTYLGTYLGGSRLTTKKPKKKNKHTHNTTKFLLQVRLGFSCSSSLKYAVEY